MSKEAVDRLRERAQNEQTVFALNDLCNQQKERITELERQNAELERQVVEYQTKHEVACSTLDIVKEQRTIAQKALSEQCKETKRLERQNVDLEPLRAQNQHLVALYDAVENLIKVKGRHNTEIAYQRLVTAFDAARDDTAAPHQQSEKECRHNKTETHYNFVSCVGCGWILPSGQIRGPNNGWFPSMDAVKEYDKFKTYPGMTEAKPLKQSYAQEGKSMFSCTECYPSLCRCLDRDKGEAA